MHLCICCFSVVFFFWFLFLGSFCQSVIKTLCSACANCIIWIFLYCNVYLIQYMTATAGKERKKYRMDRSIVKCSARLRKNRKSVWVICVSTACLCRRRNKPNNFITYYLSSIKIARAGIYAVWRQLIRSQHTKLQWNR